MLSNKLSKILTKKTGDIAGYNRKRNLQGVFIDIAISIEKQRQKLGLTQRDLAKLLHTSQPTITRWETPGYTGYTLTKLSDIADHLNCELVVELREKSYVPTSTYRFEWISKVYEESSSYSLSSCEARTSSDVAARLSKEVMA